MARKLVPAQACAYCLEVYPNNKDNFPGKDKLKCKDCWKEDKELSRQNTIIAKRDKMVNGVMRQIGERGSVHTDKALLETIYDEFDGMEGFAHHVRVCFDSAKPGSPSQTALLRSIIGLQQGVSQRSEPVDWSQYSDAELWAKVKEVSEEMLRKSAETVIDVELSEDSAATEALDGFLGSPVEAVDGSAGGTGTEETGVAETLRAVGEPEGLPRMPGECGDWPGGQQSGQDAGVHGGDCEASDGARPAPETP